jgi:hypothetical protein
VDGFTKRREQHERGEIDKRREKKGKKKAFPFCLSRHRGKMFVSVLFMDKCDGAG